MGAEKMSEDTEPVWQTAIFREDLQIGIGSLCLSKQPKKMYFNNICYLDRDFWAILSRKPCVIVGEKCLFLAFI